MNERQQQFFAGLDIGTNVIRCCVLVGEGDQDNHSFRVVALSSAPSAGVRKGIVVNPAETAEVIKDVVASAGQKSGLKISTVSVNINGSHVKGGDSRGVVAISSPNREVTNDDRLRAEDAATVVQMPSNREIVQVFAKNYIVDGQSGIKNPVGMNGVRLEVDAHIISASAPHIQSLVAAVEAAGVNVGHLVASGIACGEIVLQTPQKEAGVLVANIGGGTTNLAVIEDGEVQHVAVLPVGGNNITNDLAIGLKCELGIAKLVKHEYSRLKTIGKLGTKIIVEHNKHSYSFETTLVRMIIAARVEEILELIEKQLKGAKKNKKLPGGVVFCGGSSKISMFASMAKDILELPSKNAEKEIRIGELPNDKTLTNATVVGLAYLDFALGDVVGHDEGRDNPGMLSKKIKNMFRAFGF